MPAWADANYTKRMEIAVQTAYLDANVASFPLLAKLTNTQAIANADIASKRYDFYDHNGNRLAFEQESYSEGASYANFECWVGVPDLYASPSGDQNKVWLYYGYDYGADRDQPTAVWDSDHKGVYHMGEASGNLLDSTANGHNSTSVNGTPDYQQAGPVNFAVNFTPASEEYFAFGDVNDWDFGTGAMTVESSINTSTTDYMAIVAKNNAGFNPCWIQTVAQWPRVYMNAAERGASATTVSSGTWRRVGFTRAADGTLTHYVDGVGAANGSYNSDISTDGAGYIGSWGPGYAAYCFNGRIAEVRICAGARSAAWLKFEYRNMAEADNELTWGSEELLPSGHPTVKRFGGIPFTHRMGGAQGVQGVHIW